MEVICLYEMEVSPIEIFSLMKENIYNSNKRHSLKNINKSYSLQRKFLISLINKISTKIGFKSQTFFMAVNYLDIIFSKNNNIIYNYNLLAVGCLIIAFKFCENVPLRPIFKYFVNLYNNEIEDEKCKITKEDLFKYEVIICNILNYKLNYYTIYDFNFFFFGNGIIKIDQLKEMNFDKGINNELDNSSSNINSSSQIKKILIKIYERSRHYLDIIIENVICLKYDSLLISICIMEKSIDYVILKELISRNAYKSVDIEEIQTKNIKYFKQIMKDFYKIDFEKIPEYQNLKRDLENYKLFHNIYNKNTFNIKEKNNNNIQINNNIINNIIIENNSSSKRINVIKVDLLNKQSPTSKHSNNKKDNNFLYKKVYIPVSQNNNIKKYNKNYINKESSSSIKKINMSRENNFYSNKKNKPKILVNDKFSQKTKNFIRNSMSGNKSKSNFMKKTITSSSPFNKSPKNNLRNLFNKSNMLSKIQSQKRFGESEEIIVNHSNSIDPKKRNGKDNKNKNLERPYIKKIVQNYDKAPEENNKIKENKNININININNKIMYGEENNYKDKTQTTKKIIICKYLNNNINSVTRGKSLVNKSKENNNEEIDESSPIIERNNSIFKYKCNYIPFKFNKNHCSINENKINQNKSNLTYLKDINDNNNSITENNIIISNKNYNPYKKHSVYNIYNSNMTSRNSFQYHNHNPKLTDSFMNGKKVNLNNDSIDKKITTTILDYNSIDSTKKPIINKYRALNELKFINTSISGRNNILNTSNNINKSNYMDIYMNKKQKSNKCQISFNDSEIKESKYLNNLETYNGNNDAKKKNFSNINILDYSTGVSNEKNIY